MKVTAGILHRQPTDQLGASWSINAQVWHQKNQHDFDYFTISCAMWWAQSAQFRQLDSFGGYQKATLIEGGS